MAKIVQETRAGLLALPTLDVPELDPHYAKFSSKSTPMQQPNEEQMAIRLSTY